MFNLVELVTDGNDRAFDQPCKYGHRCDGHAVYCHNDNWVDGPRKCRRTWYTGGKTKDEDCPGFEANPEYKGELSWTPIAGSPCTRCGSKKLTPDGRGKMMETCQLCMGSGVEPTAIELTPYEQDTLELGSGRCPQDRNANQYPFVRIAETEAEDESITKLCGLDLVERCSVSFARKAGVVVHLLYVTAKGQAVMRKNWEAAKAGRQ